MSENWQYTYLCESEIKWTVWMWSQTHFKSNPKQSLVRNERATWKPLKSPPKKHAKKNNSTSIPLVYLFNITIFLVQLYVCEIRKVLFLGIFSGNIILAGVLLASTSHCVPWSQYTGLHLHVYRHVRWGFHRIFAKSVPLTTIVSKFLQ